MMIAKAPIKGIMIDSASSADILFCNACVCMNLPTNHLKSVSVPLVCFTKNSIGVEGEIYYATGHYRYLP